MVQVREHVWVRVKDKLTISVIWLLAELEGNFYGERDKNLPHLILLLSGKTIYWDRSKPTSLIY